MTAPDRTAVRWCQIISFLTPGPSVGPAGRCASGVGGAAIDSDLPGALKGVLAGLQSSQSAQLRQRLDQASEAVYGTTFDQFQVRARLPRRLVAVHRPSLLTTRSSERTAPPNRATRCRGPWATCCATCSGRSARWATRPMQSCACWSRCVAAVPPLLGAADVSVDTGHCRDPLSAARVLSSPRHCRADLLCLHATVERCATRLRQVGACAGGPARRSAGRSARTVVCVHGGHRGSVRV